MHKDPYRSECMFYADYVGREVGNKIEIINEEINRVNKMKEQLKEGRG